MQGPQATGGSSQAGPEQTQGQTGTGPHSLWPQENAALLAAVKGPRLPEHRACRFR